PWASHFVAITDDDTELSRRAHAENFRDVFINPSAADVRRVDENFRDVFINPSDIGGRYSALSFFGLVPAALMGHDAADLVGWGLAMLSASEPAADASTNPSIALGLAMAAGARAGRDKLTLLVPPALEAFGLWVEQLVAESTGKS